MPNVRKAAPRARRADSATAAVEATKNAALPMLGPPAHVRLSAAALKFWPRVIANRARDRWNDLDLTNAAELARLYADIERLRALIDKQGDVLGDGRPHPAHKLLEAAGRRAVALARMIQVHAEATQGRAQDQGNALKLENQARAATQQRDDDDLIPGARLQ
ncbi:hypothetical protein [Xanthomonas axonopodis]